MQPGWLARTPGRSSSWRTSQIASPARSRRSSWRGPWVERIAGTRVNASRLSHEELDAADELDEGDPDTLGRDHADLAALLPALAVVGGCCGTDARHVAAMWGVPTGSPRG